MFGIDEEEKKRLIDDIRKRIEEQKRRNKKRVKSFIKAGFIDYYIEKDKTNDEVMEELNGRIKVDKNITFN